MTFYVQTYPYRRMARRWAENRERTLGINVREEEDAYVLSALVPGIKSDELNIQILEDVDSKSMVTVLCPAACHTAVRVCLYIECHGLSPVCVTWNSD